MTSQSSPSRSCARMESSMAAMHPASLQQGMTMVRLSRMSGSSFSCHGLDLRHGADGEQAAAAFGREGGEKAAQLFGALVVVLHRLVGMPVDRERQAAV